MQCLAIILGCEILTFFFRKFGDGKVVVYMTLKPDGAESERDNELKSFTGMAKHSFEPLHAECCLCVPWQPSDVV